MEKKEIEFIELIDEKDDIFVIKVKELITDKFSVIKCLKTLNLTTLEEFKTEFRVISRLQGPNVVEL